MVKALVVGFSPLAPPVANPDATWSSTCASDPACVSDVLGVVRVLAKVAQKILRALGPLHRAVASANANDVLGTAPSALQPQSPRSSFLIFLNSHLYPSFFYTIGSLTGSTYTSCQCLLHGYNNSTNQSTELSTEQNKVLVVPP